MRFKVSNERRRGPGWTRCVRLDDSGRYECSDGEVKCRDER
jgi:hypothetical protein